MHSFEPEGLQLTYRETQVEIIKEASAAQGAAYHWLIQYSTADSMHSALLYVSVG